jgi:hypothetical protein
MSSQPAFEFGWAGPDDEPEIRALIASVSMPGSVSMRFAREPDYFLGASIMGDRCDVITVRNRADGHLAGIACRAEGRAFVNGQETGLGYIGQIRVAPAQRGHWLVSQGAAMFKDASPPGLLYYGVIASENPRARQLLVGKRPPAGLHVRHISGITTCAVLLRPFRPFHAKGIVVHPASAADLDALVAFLRQHGQRRQFFPAYTLADFIGGRKLRGLRPQDILLAWRGQTLAGVMSAWDQSGYKQDIVESYGPTLRRLRPLYDIAARLIGVRPLTPPGQEIQTAFAASVCVADDRTDVMRALLSASAIQAYRRGKAFLMVGLADNDPLLAEAKRFLHIPYHSDLYAVSWSAEKVAQVDARIPYIEIATL